MSFRQEDDGIFTGDVVFTAATLQSGAIGNNQIAAAAGIAASKLEHQHVLTYSQPDGADVADAIVPVYAVRGVSGTILAVEVVCLDAPERGDKTFEVDLLLCNAGSPSPATVLSAPITYPAATPDCTVRSGTIADAALADGDTLVVQVTKSGSSGNQGQGLVVVVTLRETPE